LWADLDCNQRMGSSRPNQNNYVFSVILVMHPKSYIEMMDCHDFGGKLLNHQSEGEDGCYHEKFRNFVARAELNKKSIFSRFYGTLRLSYRKQFYPKPMAPMESRDSEDVPIATLESL